MHVPDNRTCTVRVCGSGVKQEDIVVHYTEIGPEQASRIALFLHGLGTSRDDFVPYMEWLAGKYPSWRMLALDFPGFGDAACDELKENKNGIPAYVVVLKLFLDVLHIRRVCIFGWSLGGTVALAFGSAYPEYVCAIAQQGAQENGDKLMSMKVVSIAAVHVKQKRIDRGLGILLRFFKNIRGKHQELSIESFAHVFAQSLSSFELNMFSLKMRIVERMLLAWQRCDARVHAQAFASVLMCDITTELSTYKRPVLVIDGRLFDREKAPLHSGDRIAALLPPAYVTRLNIEFAGHFATMLFPELVLGETMRFFSYHVDMQTWRGRFAHWFLRQ